MSDSKNRKFIFVVGGVMSGIGKGVTTSSIARLMKSHGLVATAVKIDPYINVDAGTMNPTVHGEVFVLADGDETDQDMGNYERFLGENLTRTNYMTTGRIYQEVIRKERNLEYGGNDVKVIPEVPNEIIARIDAAGEQAQADVMVVEIGGTVGEYENLIFLEAVRRMKYERKGDVAVVMLTYLPIPPSVGEMKTKPTQMASRALNNAGIQADIIVARGEQPIDEKRKAKIAMFCNVKPEHIISAPDVSSIYDVPLNFHRDGLSESLGEQLGLSDRMQSAELNDWQAFTDSVRTTADTVKIAVVGKYFNSGNFVLSDVYISVLEALKYSGYSCGAKIDIDYISSQEFDNGEGLEKLDDYDGILVPGGFGSTGIEGKLNVIKYVRENKIPYFGICYGMQLMLVEYARNVMGLSDAHTTEVDPDTKHPVVTVMESQQDNVSSGNLGGTMRLGNYETMLEKETHAYAAYGVDTITERHRHRYEVNPEYVNQFKDAGVVFSGTMPDESLMEIAELPIDTHPFMVAAQYHPEFLARPLDPHPLFTSFVKASKKQGLQVENR